MEIEELSKAQIVLLTLLVSFVTSIATGIVTVSLMNQAPPAIAQTVNRIIEHTVETVAPAGQAASPAVSQEKTVVVNDSQLISQAVARVDPSVVRIYSNDPTSPQFLGLGVVLDSSGTVVTDANALGDYADAVVGLSDGTKVRAFVSKRTDNNLAYLAATTTASTSPVWTPATFSAQPAALGDAVVAISGNTVPRISQGIITAIIPPSAAGASAVLDTNIPSDSIMDGSLLIDESGAIVGVSTSASRASSQSGFIPASVILAASAKSAKESSASTGTTN